MSDVKAEKLVAIYQKMGAALTELERKQDEIKEQRNLVVSELLEILKSTGAESMRTSAGTVTRTVRNRYAPTNWPELYAFIKEHDAFHLLQQRVHDGNMKTFLDENPDELPPGLNCLSAYSISVRKPRS